MRGPEHLRREAQPHRHDTARVGFPGPVQVSQRDSKETIREVWRIPVLGKDHRSRPRVLPKICERPMGGMCLICVLLVIFTFACLYR